MAHPVTMHNPTTGATAQAYYGISWTSLFFGPFPALVRGQFISFILFAFAEFWTYGAFSVFLFFFYNQWHRNSLIKKGFQILPAYAPSTTVVNIINQTGHLITPDAAAHFPPPQATLPDYQSSLHINGKQPG